MKVRRRPPGHIRCVDCRKEGPPSRKDSIYCAACAVRLYQRIEAATGVALDGIALLDKMFRDSQHMTPADAIHGDGEFMYADEMFEVRK
jgi:hypothetical protein